MTIAILVVAAIAMAGVVVWAMRRGGDAQRAAIELQRAMAERDLAVSERAKAESLAADLQRRVSAAEQGRVAAEERAKHLESSREQIESTFVALAQRAFQNVGESLVGATKTQINGSLDTKKAEIDALLKPLREMVENYRGELTKSEQARVQAYGGLQEQIRSLLTAQESTQREASRLANALQSPTVRGSWGESTLRRCVEMAGMTEFCDFTMQETFIDDEGRRKRPDLIVKLPNSRVIAIDAKVPLEEYTLAANEGDETRRREHLMAHAKIVRRHVDALSKREYQASIGDTLDFVVLFVPGEHFLSAALTSDATLYDFAAERKIYLASPTVLMPLLRAINAGWKAERTEENAKKMHDVGVELFNRFVKVMEHIAGVGEQLRKTVEKYNSAIGSVDRMLWPKATELQRMAGSGKELGEIKQLDVIPLESTKLRLTTQGEEPGEVVEIKKA